MNSNIISDPSKICSLDDLSQSDEKQCSFCGEVPDHLICLVCSHLMCLICALKEILLNQKLNVPPNFSKLNCVSCKTETDLLEEVQQILVSFLQNEELENQRKTHSKSEKQRHSIIQEQIEEENCEFETSVNFEAEVKINQENRTTLCDEKTKTEDRPEISEEFSPKRNKPESGQESYPLHANAFQKNASPKTKIEKIKNGRVNSLNDRKNSLSSNENRSDKIGDLNFLKLLKTQSGKSKNQLTIFKKKLSQIQSFRESERSLTESCYKETNQFSELLFSTHHANRKQQENRPTNLKQTVAKESDKIQKNREQFNHPVQIQFISNLIQQTSELSPDSVNLDSFKLLECSNHSNKKANYVEKELLTLLCSECVVERRNNASSTSLATLTTMAPVILQDFQLLLHDLKSQTEINQNKQVDYECRKKSMLLHFETLLLKVEHSFGELINRIKNEKISVLDYLETKTKTIMQSLENETQSEMNPFPSLQSLLSSLEKIGNFETRNLTLEKLMKFIFEEKDVVGIFRKQIAVQATQNYPKLISEKEKEFQVFTEQKLSVTSTSLKLIVGDLFPGINCQSIQLETPPIIGKKCQNQLSTLLVKIQSEKTKNSQRNNNCFTRTETDFEKSDGRLIDSFQSDFYKNLPVNNASFRKKRVQIESDCSDKINRNQKSQLSPVNLTLFDTNDQCSIKTKEEKSLEILETGFESEKNAVELKIKSFLVSGKFENKSRVDFKDNFNKEISSVLSFQRNKDKDPSWFKKKLKNQVKAKLGGVEEES